MNFAFLTDKDAFYYFPLNEQENAVKLIQAVEGARYVFAEQAKSDIRQDISAERVDDDLYLRLRSEAEQSTTVQVKDFFLHQGSVHSLSQSGEYHLHLTADNSTPAGPVALGSESLGAQQAQPDAAHLKVMQHAMTFQALDELALKLSPVAEPSAHVADAEPVQMLAASEVFAAARVTPSIIEFLDKVGVNQGSVKSGNVTDDKEPTLVGMGEPNSTLDIVLNGDVIDAVKVDWQGKWSYLCEALPEGGHLFYVQDKASGEMSKFAVLIIDTMAPKRSTITSITDDTSGMATIITSDGHTRDTTPTLFGTADANTLVIIYNHNVPIHSIYADLNGNWTWTPLSLPEGNYAFKVAAMDFSGNIGLASKEDYRITIGDLVSIPAITSITDNVGAQQGSLANNAQTDDKQPTLSGTAEVNARVEIFDKGAKLGETRADASGIWTFTPTLPLSEGTHTFTVRAISQTGKISEPSPAWNITVDVTAPSKPGIDGEGPGLHEIGGNDGPIKNGGTTNDNKPTFKGEGTPGDTIIIIDEKSGEVIGETKVDEKGNWELAPNPALKDGEHEIVVIIEDPAGNQSEKSDPIVIVVDATAPNAPVIGGVISDVGGKLVELVSGEATNDTTPTFIGTTEANARVDIFDNNVLIGSTVADSKGNWSFTPKVLEGGDHSFTTRATDTAGNTSAASPAWNIEIDVTVPSKPGTDGEGPGLHEIGGSDGPIKNGGTTNDNTPTFKGEGEPGDTIIIIDEKSGEVIGETKVDEKGNWELTPNPALKDGEHEIVVVIEDPAGNQSEKSDPIVIVVDTTAPNAPAIGSVIGDVGGKFVELVSGEATNDTTPTFKGTTEANARVDIFDNNVLIGSTVADGQGSWSFTPKALEEGDHSFITRATDAAGNTSVASPAWNISVDVTAPSKPGTDGQGPGINDIGGVTNDNTPTFSGKGEPGYTIIILDNNQKIGEVVVGENGTWEFTPETALGDGDHAISIIIQDPAGNQSEKSDPIVIVVDTTAPNAPAIGSVIGDVGGKFVELVSGGATNDTTPTFKGTTEANARVDIFDNDVLIGSTVADAQGSWSFTPKALEEGDHSFITRATDAAGNTSAPSPAWNISVDVTAPSKPGTDGQGPGIKDIGGVTNDNTPTFSGKGEPGDTIIILDNNQKIGEVVVGENGTWEFTPETALGDGDHAISIIIQDPAGNRSEPSDSQVIVVDTQAPNAPVLENVDPRIPSISGTAEANSRVDIFDNEELIGSTIADSQGHWSFTPKALEEGGHSLTTRATDPAGNVSEQSPAWEIEITLAPPARPSIESIYDDVGAERGTLTAGSVTDDNRPRITGSSDPLTTVIIFNHGMEIGRAQADGQGNWSFTLESALADGIYSLSTVAIGTAGRSSETSEPFEVIVYTGNGPTQVARLSHMGKDSGVDGHDFVTDNGSFGRLMHGVLSAELKAGQALMVSTDGGNSWFEALVKGTNWVAQDLSKHQGNWSIQTRIQGANGEAGFVMEQGVVLDTTAPRAPTSLQLNGSNLHIAFDASNVVAGDRISVIADGGAHRFEYTLSASDIAAGSVNLDVGLISSASAALVDQAGNLSGFANTGSAPKANFVLTDDVSEVYGTSRNNVFTIEDVSVLQNIKLLEGNSGEDTLKLAGANQLLDFSVLQSRLSSIEVIDITGTGNNTLRISLSDVLELGHHNAFMDEETVQLAIRGDVGDSVELSHLLLNGMDVGDWEITGSVTVAGYQYEVYRHTELSADLLVQQGVSIQQV